MYVASLKSVSEKEVVLNFSKDFELKSEIPVHVHEDNSCAIAIVNLQI